LVKLIALTMKHEATVADLPQVPFSLYFMQEMEVFPKKMFTVTRKNEDANTLYIMEVKRDVKYDYYNMDVVAQVWPN
jgi:hypothetical protein